MGYYLSAERLDSEVKKFLENDRIPERRMLSITRTNFLESLPIKGGIEGFQERHERAKQLEPWPGDRWREPIGSHRNPFLRQSKNITLAVIILTDPTRQQEAFDKLLEAGYKPKDAKSLLEKYHQNVEVTERS